MHRCKRQLKAELDFCMKLWEEQGHCTFGEKTQCSQCAAPYVLWKLLTGEVIHGDQIPRLTLEQWHRKIEELK